MKKARINIAAPDIICICVDGRDQGDGWGRVYCCYSEKEICFRNEYHLLAIIEGILEALDYPQTSVRIRSFDKDVAPKTGPRPTKVLESQEVVSHLGKLCTFMVYIQYRQNATWQGELAWKETGKSIKFRSALEFLKLIDNALDSAESE